MNYYETRELLINDGKTGSGKFRYTCMNDSRVWAVGYCAPFIEAKTRDNGGVFVTQDSCDLHNSYKDKYHTEPHDTAIEACNCYREYLIDCTLVTYDERKLKGDTQKPPYTVYTCAICGAPTRSYMAVGAYGMELYHLCTKHLNVESLCTLMGFGTLKSSYSNY